MTRHYDEPVDVRRRDDVPAEFLWRGRLYLVRDVFASWVETEQWWQSGTPVRVPASLRAEPAEREMWRVEATGGRAAGTGIFDLCFDWTVGQWNLVQVID